MIADLGQPILYGLGVELRQEGDLMCRNENRVGIRTLELDQSPDPGVPGTSKSNSAEKPVA